jgi:hypothetical protein
MVALLPANPDALTVTGGDPPEELHLTIRYLGEAAGVDAETRQYILDRISAVSAMGPPIEVSGSGLVIMGEDDAGQPATAVLCENEDIVYVRDLVDEELADVTLPEDTHPVFIPHMTLGYGLDPTAADVADRSATSIVFDRLVVAFGDDRTEYPLASASDASEPTEAPMPSTMTIRPRAQAAEGDPPADVGSSIGAGFVTFATVDMTDDAAVVDALGAVPAFEMTAAIAEDGSAVLSGQGLADLRNALAAVADTTWPGADDSVTVPADAGDGGPIADGDVVAVDSVTVNAAAGPVDVTLGGQAADASAEDESTRIAAAAEKADPLPAQAPDAADQGAIPGDPRFTAVLVVEGVPSGDGRMIQQGALTWRDLPLPFMAMFRNPEGGQGHDGAEIAARIDNIYRDGDKIMAEGEYDVGSPSGLEAMRLRDTGMMRGVSVDLDMVEAEYENDLPVDGGLEDLLTWDAGMLIVTSARIMGATQTCFPAFPEAQIIISDAAPDAIAASGGKLPSATVWTPWEYEGGTLIAAGSTRAGYPANPPLAWMERPSLDDDVYAQLRSDPNLAIITDEGRYLAYLGTWDSCHVSFDGRCVGLPRSATGYRGFRCGSVLTSEGTVVATGVVILDTVHPDLKLSASDAQAFYAHSGCGAVDVAPYEDDIGVLLCGALRPDVTAGQVRILRASRTSGDWRRIDNHPRELIAVLTVNLGGFRSMRPATLVASGTLDGAGENPRRPGAFAFRLIDNEVETLVAAGSVASPLQVRLEALEAKVDGLMRSTHSVRAEHVRRRWHATRKAS